MEDDRFDRLTRGIAGLSTRRGTVAGLLGGFALPLLGGSLTEARNRRGDALQAEKKRKKKCKSGLLTCTIKTGKKKKKLCVDAQTDPLNCGGCGILCASGQSCQGGNCTCNGAPCAGCCDGTTCRAGTAQDQCGTAGAVCQGCSGGRSCQNGTCTCPAGQTFCGGACVDPTTDANNCGTCGNRCTLPQSCGGGGKPGVCGCTSTTCVAEGKNCGDIPDGCGSTLTCGTCTLPRQTCGGSGTPNVCGCGPLGMLCDNSSQCCSASCCPSETDPVKRCRGGCG